MPFLRFIALEFLLCAKVISVIQLTAYFTTLNQTPEKDRSTPFDLAGNKRPLLSPSYNATGYGICTLFLVPPRVLYCVDSALILLGQT